MNLHFSATYK